jgi:formylmethanofuran dehydrogenase subunit C
MKGGELEIEGSVFYRFLGKNMQGGKITISGFAGYEVGHYMKGGEIHIQGDYGSLGYIEKGRIYHRGKLIVDK